MQGVNVLEYRLHMRNFILAEVLLVVDYG